MTEPGIPTTRLVSRGKERSARASVCTRVALVLPPARCDRDWNEHNRVTTNSCSLRRYLCRLPFPFCNHKQLTPYSDVLFRGSRGGVGVVGNSVAAAIDSRC